MRNVLAWLGVATMLVLSSSIAHATGPTVVKPYVVLILDTSGSMTDATGSGPPTCPDANGNLLPDTKLNHAKCAIFDLANTYGDMILGLGRFRNLMSGTFPSCCSPGPDVKATGSCPAGITCDTSAQQFEMLNSVVDGNNGLTSVWVDETQNTCTAVGSDPEIFTANSNTPLEGVLRGVECYWTGQNESTTTPGCVNSGGDVTWPPASPGFNPIVNDPLATQFLPSGTGCDPSPACTTNCCTSQCRPYVVILLTDGDDTCNGTEGHCSATTSTLCTVDGDCPGGQTCSFTPGHCSVSVGTSCYNNADCPTPQTCIGGASIGAAADAMLRTVVTTGSPATAKKYRVQTYPIGFGTPAPYGPIEQIAHGGGAPTLPGVNAGFYASDQAGLELAFSQIIEDSIRSETCNNLDDDCDGKIDEDFPLKGKACDNGLTGVCKGTGAFVCTADGTGVQCNITNPGQPAQTSCPAGDVCNPDGTEICGDGKDNDCDGFIDEGCTACIPTAEICDGKDNDCDGKIDEDIAPRQCSAFPGASCFPNAGCCGTEVCINGAFSGCNNTVTPGPEVCNNIDDDCDGVVDEDLTRACSNITGNGCATPPCPATNNPGDPSDFHCTGLKQKCSGPADPSCPGAVACIPPIAQNQCQPGTETCVAGVFGACTGEVVPTAEICNALDDDCDNIIDENTGGGTCNGSCGVGVIACAGSPVSPACCEPGTCLPGQNQCGTLFCNAAPVNGDFTCNGVDDDCDGQVDEDWVCSDPTGNSSPAVPCACTAPNICNGQNKCVNGAVECVGVPVDPTSCCDCNGNPQTGTCGTAGAQCASNCQCALPCSGGEFPCSEGDKCDLSGGLPGLCVHDPCFGVICGLSQAGNAQECIDQNNNGVCVEVCAQMSCSSGERCLGSTGQCLPDDCTSPFPDRQCAANQNCVVDPNTGIGMCITNPCSGVTCPDAQYCEQGTCVLSCASVTCPSGQRCALGACQPDPCNGPCPAREVCDAQTGLCVEDPCLNRICPEGEWCNPADSMCETDPCNGTTCPTDPPGQTCSGGTCSAPPIAPTGSHVTAAGSGCSSTGGTGGVLVLVGVFGLGGLRRRRRGGAS